MKNRILISLSLVGIIASCASNPELDDEKVVTKKPKASNSAPMAGTPKDTNDKSANANGPKADPRIDWQGQLSEALKTQDEDKIVAAAEKIISENPADIRALNSMAMVHYRHGKFEVSRNLLSSGLKLQPKSAELHSNLGLVLYSMGETFDGIKELRKAVEIMPDHAQANATLGSIYVQNKDYAKAIIVLETAYLKGVRDLKTLNNYAITLSVRKENSLAQEMFEKILKETPHDKEVMMNYAIFLIENLEKYKEGLDLINRLKFVGVPPESKSRILALENKAKSGLK